MSEDNKADVEFLEHQLEELQRIHPYLEELGPDDFSAKDGLPETSDEAERCARLADRYELDGSIFRNLIPPSFDARPDVRAMLRPARKQMEMIPKVIAAIEQQVAAVVPEDAAKYSAPKSPTEWAKLYGWSTDTLRRRIEDGSIHVIKLSTKSYRIRNDHLPEM